MDRTTRAAVVLIAVAAFVAGLYSFRDILSQFALAVILWLGVEGLASWLDRRIPGMPRILALPIALVIVLATVGLVFYFLVQTIGDFTDHWNTYRDRLNGLAADIYARLDLRNPPTMQHVLQEIGGRQIVANLAGRAQGLLGDIVFILIYLGFLFVSAVNFSDKLDYVFSKPAHREHARQVLTAIRESMEKYLWVQTMLSILSSSLTYITLRLIGLDNALFWAFLIFFLNYIPTIGSIIAVVLPTVFAIVQFPSLTQVALVAGGVGFWQFSIGNFVQPRVTGDSLNLSPIVVLLSLGFWGALWGIVGAFLSAPLSVMVMIILAQFSSTRWLAIMLSEDGRPPSYRGPRIVPEPAGE